MSCAAVLSENDSSPAIPDQVICADADGDTFAALGLPSRLTATVARLGYTSPTAIQAAAIPPLLAGSDVTGVAQTGTGKTAAFGLPLLAAIDPQLRRVQSIVLAPTRELALQVAHELEKFAASLPGVKVTAVYGGAPFGQQVSALRGGAQVVVGTPGRIIDHLTRGTLVLDAVQFAVLDEADEMLRMGFVEDVDRILSAAPTDRQTALFSATMPRAIRAVAQRHLRQPVDVSVASSATPVTAIHQQYAILPYRQKADALVRILAVSDADAAVVFVRTRKACDEVGTQLLTAGLKAAVISGDVTQVERERTMARLRSRQIDVLVATDVAARGMDVERIGLVVNFDAPGDPEAYVHRVGRTGRAGRAGHAVLFLTPREKHQLRSIERATAQRLEPIDIPTAADVAQHRASAALRGAAARHEAGRLDTYRAALHSAAHESGVSVVDLAAALLAVTVQDDGVTREPDPITPSSSERYNKNPYRKERSNKNRQDSAYRGKKPADRPSGGKARNPRNGKRPAPHHTTGGGPRAAARSHHSDRRSR